ncbi:MAG: hypothetical protein ACP5Q0_06450 [Halothiobacillus sp.]
MKLDQQNIAGAEVLVPLTFIVILGTVVTASLTARPLARLIGEALPVKTKACFWWAQMSFHAGWLGP